MFVPPALPPPPVPLRTVPKTLQILMFYTFKQISTGIFRLKMTLKPAGTLRTSNPTASCQWEWHETRTVRRSRSDSACRTPTDMKNLQILAFLVLLNNYLELLQPLNVRKPTGSQRPAAGAVS